MNDTLIHALDSALRTVFAPARAQRSWQHLAASSTVNPTPPLAPAPELTEPEKRHAAGLMRVNHVGEICAQALYTAQALTCRDAWVRSQLTQAAQEETDHLAWTEQRLHELDARPSLLNPLWYAGAFAIGLAAGRAGERWSLGFVSETERQVEAHLASHLEDPQAGGLPLNDQTSRAIVAQMKQDEAHHGQQARDAGAAPLPTPIQTAMQAAAKVMTTVAYRV